MDIIEGARPKCKRAGGEKRGNSYDRARRRAWMLSQPKWNGDGVTCECVHCHSTLTDATVEADRIIPGSLGGTYRRDNIQPACRSCNLARSDDPSWVFVPGVVAAELAPQLELSAAA